MPISLVIPHKGDNFSLCHIWMTLKQNILYFNAANSKPSSKYKIIFRFDFSESRKTTHQNFTKNPAKKYQLEPSCHFNRTTLSHKPDNAANHLGNHSNAKYTRHNIRQTTLLRSYNRSQQLNSEHQTPLQRTFWKIRIFPSVNHI